MPNTRTGSNTVCSFMQNKSRKVVQKSAGKTLNFNARKKNHLSEKGLILTLNTATVGTYV